MSLAECPYCKMLGLVTTIKSSPGGFEVNGHCSVCGYGCDSQYEGGEVTDDLPFEFEEAAEIWAKD